MKKIFQRLKRAPKWLKISFFTILILVIAIHVFLPPVLKHYLNKAINNVEGHSGYIEDIDISIIRGAYRIEGLHLFSDELGKEHPLAVIDEIDISVEWKALFQGSLVAEIEFLNPEVYFVIAGKAAAKPNNTREDKINRIVEEKTEGIKNPKRRKRVEERQTKKLEKEMAPEKQTAPKGKTKNNFDKVQITVFRDLLLDKIPLKVNRIALINGKVVYDDKSSKPEVAVETTKINFELNNLTNSSSLSESLIADFNCSALLMGTGKLSINGAMDPYDKDVTLDLDVQLKDFDLKELNKMFEAYANFDVDKGVLSIFTEVSINSGQLKGYIKPFIDNLSIMDYQDDKDESALNIVWQTLLGGVSEITRNLKHDEFATKIPLEGNVSDPNFKVLKTVGNLFMHAIFHSIKPKLDQAYNLKKDAK